MLTGQPACAARVGAGDLSWIRLPLTHEPPGQGLHLLKEYFCRPNFTIFNGNPAVLLASSSLFRKSMKIAESTRREPFKNPFKVAFWERTIFRGSLALTYEPPSNFLRLLKEVLRLLEPCDLGLPPFLPERILPTPTTTYMTLNQIKTHPKNAMSGVDVGV